MKFFLLILVYIAFQSTQSQDKIGSILISCNEIGTRIYSNNDFIGFINPETKSLLLENYKVGEYSLTLKKRGFVTYNRTITILENRITDVKALLESLNDSIKFQINTSTTYFGKRVSFSRDKWWDQPTKENIIKSLEDIYLEEKIYITKSDDINIWVLYEVIDINVEQIIEESKYSYKIQNELMENEIIKSVLLPPGHYKLIGILTAKDFEKSDCIDFEITEHSKGYSINRTGTKGIYNIEISKSK